MITRPDRQASCRCFLPLLALTLAHSAAANTAVTAAAQPPVSCLSSGDGYLRARLAGAIDAEIDWPNSGTQCDGEARQEPRGVRAVDSFTIGAAKELAPRGIRVNAVVPGLIDTEIHAKAGLADRLAKLGATVPMGRVGTAEEVALAILWLLSDEARYVTGAFLPVSGGR